jgi:hypothetical protein
MTGRISLAFAAIAAIAAPNAHAGSISVTYFLDAGGGNTEALNGLEAMATFEVVGTQMTILLENTSDDIPMGFDGAASLLVSLGMNLPDAVLIVSGDTAVIGPGSEGLGTWAGRVAGDSVAEQWGWTNDQGGDLLGASHQVITTSEGSHDLTLFGGGEAWINGPSGGIAAKPPTYPLNDNFKAVSDSILFTLKLSATLTNEQLEAVANESIVEFGSDARYLATRVPEPATAALLGFSLLFAGRRRIGAL